MRANRTQRCVTCAMAASDRARRWVRLTNNCDRKYVQIVASRERTRRRTADEKCGACRAGGGNVKPPESMSA